MDWFVLSVWKNGMKKISLKYMHHLFKKSIFLLKKKKKKKKKTAYVCKKKFGGYS